MPDPLQIEAARLALRWSRRDCREVAGVKPDCGWYHGFWQIARVLGVGRVTGGQADFLTNVLREHARDSRFRRVLVSGTADHALPALVYRAYEEAGAQVELTVVDWCETASGDELVTFGADEAARFCAEIDARIDAQAQTLGMDAAVVAVAAREYVRRFAVHPVRSHVELHRELLLAGFGDSRTEVTPSRPVQTPVSGPSTHEQGSYARIVATRR